MNREQELRTAERDQTDALSEAERKISDQLLAARKSAVPLDGFPGIPPLDASSAYRVQRHSIGRWPDQIAGWKVGGVPTELCAELGANWLVGPIFERTVRIACAGETALMPVFARGFAAIEPELVIKLGRTRCEDRMFIGIEIASSPVPAINDFGPTAVICDFGNNHGLLVGDEIIDWSMHHDSLEVSISINDKEIGSRILRNVSSQALQARDFCIEHASREGRKLEPGTLISTGAITGIHEAGLGARSKVSFVGIGNLQLKLVDAKPL